MSDLYRSGKVTRYHSEPELNIFGQTDGDHAWGVAAIILATHPNPSLGLIANAIFHDSGELFAGDMPYECKAMYPVHAKNHAKIEMRETPAPPFHLTVWEGHWLKMADMLEAHCFCKLRRPDLLDTPKWVEQREMIESLAAKVGADISEFL